MFEPNQNTGDIIHIQEFEMSTIKKMITFIYSDEIKNPEDNIDVELLNIADKYQIQALRNLCENTLSRNVNIDNVLDAWKSAYLLNASKLLDASETFISRNWDLIKSSKQFINMQKEDSH